MKSLSPEASRKRGLKEKGANGVGSGANHALGLAVLGGGIGARHTQLDTEREEESTRGGVIELTPIVTLDGLDGAAELSGHPGEEVVEGGESLGLSAQGKSPGVVREVVKHNKVVLVARNARNRRSPQITVYKVKDSGRM